MKASRRAMNMNYAIRQVTIPADEMENKGAEVIRMNIGDPNKWDFETPEYFKAALREAVDMVDNGYGDSQGSIELREAIVDREFEKHGARISADDVIVTNGVSEAIMVIMGALLEPGDEILVPGPGYSSYTQYIKYFDAVPVPYEQVEENDWQPDVDMMRSRITERTRAIVVINPNNPTGAVYPEKAVREIGDLAAEFNLPVISDEIYDKITFNTRFFSFSRTPSDVMKIILNGFSKVNLMPGWRVGYGYFMDEKGELEEIFEGVMRQLRARLCPNVPCQWAARAALQGPQDYISTLNAKLSSRADYTYKRLNEIPGISVKKAKGSMFMFPKVEANLWKDDMDFILDLLWNTGVLFVPGSGFCEEFGKNHFRTIILPDIPILEKAYDRVETFMIGKLKSR
ncbi:MAG TPA: aminotransferase class I/II-fold pyridoxal phosphate-dependent enzyme [Candidatus Methanomethylophilaceae archaeon]|nr:aminotransferase class I/II-fold pyridoxal phosphate-dependent enzyme [Candidatus Methanomethylophilaceae archaeon]